MPSSAYECPSMHGARQHARAPRRVRVQAAAAAAVDVAPSYKYRFFTKQGNLVRGLRRARFAWSRAHSDTPQSCSRLHARHCSAEFAPRMHSHKSTTPTTTPLGATCLIAYVCR